MDTMTSAIATALLSQRRYAYAITDRDLRVLRRSGLACLWPACAGETTDPQGIPLGQIAPELLAHRADLHSLVAGELPRFDLPMVHRGERADEGPYVTLINVPYRDECGAITGVLHCVEEITQTVLIQQRLTQHRNELSLLRDQLARQNGELSAANVELQRLDQVKSTFISTAAHELRTPISAIVGYTEILLDQQTGPLNGEQRQYLGVIERNVKRLLGLGGNLLDITRLELGHMELSLRPTDLLDLAEQAAEQIQPAIDSRQQQFMLDASPGLPHALCDPARTLQILTNLLSNASKYTPPGGTITLRLQDIADAGTVQKGTVQEGTVQIIVQDTGVGIPQADQDRLFERFFRASNVRPQDESIESGVGLGLYIVKMLVELQGGSIRFESQLNQGSTFYVTLPVTGDERP